LMPHYFHYSSLLLSLDAISMSFHYFIIFRYSFHISLRHFISTLIFISLFSFSMLKIFRHFHFD
jgi:hypothetical protein